MIKKVSVVLAMIIMLLGMPACGADAGQEATDSTAGVQMDEGHTDIQDETKEPEDKPEAEGEKAMGENKSDVENEAAGDEDSSALNNEAAGSEGEAEVKKAVEPENELENKEGAGEQTEMKMNVRIGDYNFTAKLENNTAVDELVDMMKEGPVSIEMDDYSGFEKVGSLGRSLTASNSQTTTAAGDIVLYNSSNIVMFYGSNSWSYTRIGKIDDLTDWEKALGRGSITAVFSIAE